MIFRMRSNSTFPSLPSFRSPFGPLALAMALRYRSRPWSFCCRSCSAAWRASSFSDCSFRFCSPVHWAFLREWLFLFRGAVWRLLWFISSSGFRLRSSSGSASIEILSGCICSVGSGSVSCSNVDEGRFPCSSRCLILLYSFWTLALSIKVCFFLRTESRYLWVCAVPCSYLPLSPRLPGRSPGKRFNFLFCRSCVSAVGSVSLSISVLLDGPISRVS